MKNPIFYSGYGINEIPANLIEPISLLAKGLEKLGFTLRTGDDKGTNSTFARSTKKRHVYMPTDVQENRYGNQQLATIMTEKTHPAWGNVLELKHQNNNIKNCYVLLGRDLKTPSKFLVFYGGKNTSNPDLQFVLRLAKQKNIPVFDLEKIPYYTILKQIEEKYGEQYE